MQCGYFFYNLCKQTPTGITLLGIIAFTVTSDEFYLNLDILDRIFKTDVIFPFGLYPTCWKIVVSFLTQTFLDNYTYVFLSFFFSRLRCRISIASRKLYVDTMSVSFGVHFHFVLSYVLFFKESPFVSSRRHEKWQGQFWLCIYAYMMFSYHTVKHGRLHMLGNVCHPVKTVLSWSVECLQCSHCEMRPANEFLKVVMYNNNEHLSQFAQEVAQFQPQSGFLLL